MEVSFPSILKHLLQRTANDTCRWYQSLSARTRLLVGVGVMGYGCLGLFLSDKAEKVFDMVPTEQDKERLKHVIPKVRFVDKAEVQRERDG